MSTCTIGYKRFWKPALHIGLPVNTPHTHTHTYPTHTHPQKKERKKERKKQDQIIECLIILMPNFINHKIASFSIQVLVHNQLEG